MVLLAPTVTALQTLLELCRAYAGPYDIVYNTTKTVCMLVLPKQSQGRCPTRVRLGNEELGFADEFHYQRHALTTDCREDKDIEKQFRRQNAVGNMLVRKFSFSPMETKIQLFKSYCYPIYGCVLWRHSIIKLTVSYTEVAHSNDFLMSSVTPARVLHLCMMNTTDHINVVISLHWWISGRICYVHRNNHKYNFPAICQCVMNDFAIS